MPLRPKTLAIARPAAAAALLALLFAAPVSAVTRTLNAADDPNVASEFELIFTDFDPELKTASDVVDTEYDLELDADVGTARFTRYEQHIEELILPDGQGGGISTGPLTVTILTGDATGTYNAATGEFATQDNYQISFTGDLTAFGITEKTVVLPGAATGHLRVEDGVEKIEMNWAGLGQLANPLDPLTPINFSYTCKTNTVVQQPVVSPIAGLCGLFGLPAFGMILAGMGLMRLRFRQH